MMHNVCTGWEKALRVILGIDFFALPLFLSGQWAYLGLIGIIPILTAVIGYCPVKHMLGITTCRIRARHA